jgi:predicted Ser/Thr protein kinase/tetratricopeptide (TPR) repeat protein
MNLHDLVEAYLAGERPDVPEGLREDFDHAVVGHLALQGALADTVALPPAGPSAHRPPVLPDDYEVVRELGSGGMGVVYLARQKSLERLVAVKVLRPGAATFGRVVQRFLEEARHLARLRHANIVSIHEVGRAGEEPYFTMDYVEGEPLAALLARERLSPSRALALWKQAAEGVGHAHTQGIIHRDLKPGNILVDARGRAYVTDFGLARDMTQASRLTHTGEILGTPAYMAPEQARGQGSLVGEATDVHALGAILYEMLTGRPPYGNDAPVDVLVRVLKEEPLAARRIDRRVPRDLETICLKALAKAPERRYATVGAFLEDIRRFEAGLSVLARRPGRIARGLRLLRRHGKIAAAVLLTTLLTVALTIVCLGPSADQLLAAGDERHTAGKHAEAARLYQRALRWPGVHSRVALLERLIRCCREAGDDRGATDAALQMLDEDPDAWFGDLDYAVARAVRAHQHAVKANPYCGITRDLSPEELAIKRLQICLNEPYGSETDRARAEQTLIELRASFGEVPAGFTGIPAEGITLPEGTPAELRRRADDEKAPLVERALAAFAGAAALEKAGETPAALAAYHQAYELFRQHFPIYAGAVRGLEMSHPRSLRLECRECSLLRHIAHAVLRLDPGAKDPLRGGLRFRITRLDLPPDLAVQLTLSLGDPKVTVSAPFVSVPVRIDQTAWVGVADGRYRLTVQYGSKGGLSSESFGARAGLLYGRMVLDFSGLPEEVEVRGSTVELPPVRAWLRE